MAKARITALFMLVLVLISGLVVISPPTEAQIVPNFDLEVLPPALVQLDVRPGATGADSATVAITNTGSGTLCILYLTFN